MVYGCGNSFIKFLVFAFNLLICVSGGLILGVSLWANLDKNFSSHLATFIDKTGLSSEFEDLGKYQASLWVLVGVGGLLFLVGFLGCCGAGCESPVLLTLFFVIVLILAVIELGAAIFAVANKEEFRSQIKNMLEKGYNTTDGPKQFKFIQDTFTCCGPVLGRPGLDCTPPQQSAGNCFDVIWNDVETAGSVAIIIAFVVLVIEVFSLIFSCVLCRAIRERGPGYYA